MTLPVWADLCVRLFAFASFRVVYRTQTTQKAQMRADLFDWQLNGFTQSVMGTQHDIMLAKLHLDTPSSFLLLGKKPFHEFHIRERRIPTAMSDPRELDVFHLCTSLLQSLICLT